MLTFGRLQLQDRDMRLEAWNSSNVRISEVDGEETNFHGGSFVLPRASKEVAQIASTRRFERMSVGRSLDRFPATLSENITIIYGICFCESSSFLCRAQIRFWGCRARTTISAMTIRCRLFSFMFTKKIDHQNLPWCAPPFTSPWVKEHTIVPYHTPKQYYHIALCLKNLSSYVAMTPTPYHCTVPWPQNRTIVLHHDLKTAPSNRTPFQASKCTPTLKIHDIYNDLFLVTSVISDLPVWLVKHSEYLIILTPTKFCKCAFDTTMFFASKTTKEVP